MGFRQDHLQLFLMDYHMTLLPIERWLQAHGYGVTDEDVVAIAFILLPPIVQVRVASHTL
jgi:hypothetical protein